VDAALRGLDEEEMDNILDGAEDIQVTKASVKKMVEELREKLGEN